MSFAVGNAELLTQADFVMSGARLGDITAASSTLVVLNALRLVTSPHPRLHEHWQLPL